MGNSLPLLDLRFDDPEAFETALAPLGGNAAARPLRGARLEGRFRAVRLERIGLFEVSADAMRVRQREVPRCFHGLTIPRASPFCVAEPSGEKTFENQKAHYLHPARELDLRSDQGTDLFVANFFVDDLDTYAQRLGSGKDFQSVADASGVPLATPEGSGLARYLRFVWEEANQGGGIMRSPLVAKEVEDALIAAFVATLQAAGGGGKAFEDRGFDDRRIRRAEEYLLAHVSDPVSRAELAEHAGLSIRSLSRGFRKRHGVGPMTFVRRHRLEAIRADLLAADPGTTKVSELAARYGFSDFGRFSTAYKSCFGESPSQTLRR